MANIANNQRMANLANAKLTSDLTSSATSVTVDDASVFPTPTFYATLMPGDEMSNKNNSEIVRVTAVNSNTFTIARAQRGTTARAFTTGSVLTNGSYIEDLEYAQSVGRTAFNTSYSQGVYTIVDNVDMLPNIPSDGMRITIIVNTDSAGTPGLDLRGNGSIYSIYTGMQFNGDYYNDPAVLYAGKMYNLVFNNGYWYATNVAAQITADDMDGTYAGTFAYLSGNQVTPSSNVYVYTNNIDDGAVTSDKLDATVLYNYTGSGHGESGPITLSAPFTNFKYVEVFAENLDGGHTSTKVLGSCSRGYLSIIDYYNNAFYLKTAQFRVSGTALTWGHNDYQMRLLTNGTNAIDANSKWGILKIIGYN